MSKCQWCKELNEEEFEIEIDSIYVQGGYYNWSCPIRYCPACGQKLKKYSQEEK